MPKRQLNNSDIDDPIISFGECPQSPTFEDAPTQDTTILDKAFMLPTQTEESSEQMFPAASEEARLNGKRPRVVLAPETPQKQRSTKKRAKTDNDTSFTVIPGSPKNVAVAKIQDTLESLKHEIDECKDIKTLSDYELNTLDLLQQSIQDYKKHYTRKLKFLQTEEKKKESIEFLSQKLSDLQKGAIHVCGQCGQISMFLSALTCDHSICHPCSMTTMHIDATKKTIYFNCRICKQKSFPTNKIL